MRFKKIWEVMPGYEVGFVCTSSEDHCYQYWPNLASGSVLGPKEEVLFRLYSEAPKSNLWLCTGTSRVTPGGTLVQQ